MRQMIKVGLGIILINFLFLSALPAQETNDDFELHTRDKILFRNTKDRLFCKLN